MSTYAARRRESRTAAVFLSVVILAVIGGVFGAVMGVRANGEPDAAGTPTPTPSQPSQEASKPATPCPQFIKDATNAPQLQEVFWMRTEDEEVWICFDPVAKRHWYQGHEKDKRFHPDEKVVEGQNGLLLDRVLVSVYPGTKEPEYIATNEDNNGVTKYYVNRHTLKVLQGDRKILDHAVVDYRPRS